MPTAAEVLTTAKQAFEKYQVNPSPIQASMGAIQGDLAEMRIVKVRLGNDVVSLSAAATTLKEKIAGLNNALSVLNKNAGTITSPADKGLLKERREEIAKHVKDGNQLVEKLEGLKKEIGAALK